MALSDVVGREELNAAYIIPSVFHPGISSVVAKAVADAAGGRDDRIAAADE